MPFTTPPAHVVAFGRPGSGKSSLAERLRNEFGYTLIRTGELLREAVRRGDPLGVRVQGYLEGGHLVPDPLVFDLLAASLSNPGQRKLLFDGFPRTEGQVAQLEQLEARDHFEVDCYLVIALSREAAEARMTGRRVCPVCGATYHVRTRPPRVAGRCDLDGAALERRPDDSPEVIDQRQRLYDEHAPAILAHYLSRVPQKVVSVDGDQPFDAVYDATCRALGLRPTSAGPRGR